MNGGKSWKTAHFPFNARKPIGVRSLSSLLLRPCLSMNLMNSVLHKRTVNWSSHVRYRTRLPKLGHPVMSLFVDFFTGCFIFVLLQCVGLGLRFGEYLVSFSSAMQNRMLSFAHEILHIFWGKKRLINCVKRK